MGRDASYLLGRRVRFLFQSTRPVWGATKFDVIDLQAPRHFNPRAPCGARPPHRSRICSTTQFQSTRPVWGATNAVVRLAVDDKFQSTRPVWGATKSSLFSHLKTGFQSTRPVWGATANLTILPRQICTKGTKEFLLGRKTHGKKEKIKQKLAYIHAFSAFLGCEGSGTFCALVLRTQYR